MKIYGRVRGEVGEVPLALVEASILVTADEALSLADFFQQTAELMKKAANSFGHEHYKDFCKRAGLPCSNDGGDVIIVGR
jgi:hypothetical protein